MDKPVTLATLSTQDIGRRQTKQNHNTEHKIDEQHGSHQKQGRGDPCARVG